MKKFNRPEEVTIDLWILSDKSIVLFLSAFQVLSAVELVYQINKIALITASI